MRGDPPRPHGIRLSRRNVAACILVIGFLPLGACGISGAEGAAHEVQLDSAQGGSGEPAQGDTSSPPAAPEDDGDEGPGPAAVPNGTNRRHGADQQVPAPLPQGPPPPAQPPPPPAYPDRPTTPLSNEVTAQVILSGSQGVALRAAPTASSRLRGRAADGTTLLVECAEPGQPVSVGAPRFRGTSVWVRTDRGPYVSLLYLEVDGHTTLPDCRPGRAAVPLTITGTR
jgi:hypothetical protein